MWSIFKKEVSGFFSSLIGYIVIAVFLVLTGLFMWVFGETSILQYNYATMQQLFFLAPMVFLFLIPAITMGSFAEELQQGTIEFLSTKPLRRIDIVLGKFLASLCLVIIALLPSLLYYYSIVELGRPKGNIDTGEVVGSYIGLFCLAGVFVAMGMFASSVTRNQIVAFILGAVLCFTGYWVFDFVARLPVFAGSLDYVIEQFGLSYHYYNISQGALDSSDIIYFVSLIVFFVYLTWTSLRVKAT